MLITDTLEHANHQQMALKFYIKAFNVMYREGSRCSLKYAMHDIKQLKNCLPDLLTKYGNQRLKQKADAVKEKLQVLHVFLRF